METNKTSASSKINEYSGIIGLITSLLTLAYIFGSLSTRVANLEQTYMSEHQIITIIDGAVEKEREISDSKYYIRPEIAIQYLSKQQFQQYMELYLETAEDYKHVWKDNYTNH